MAQTRHCLRQGRVALGRLSPYLPARRRRVRLPAPDLESRAVGVGTVELDVIAALLTASKLTALVELSAPAQRSPTRRPL